MRHLLFGLILFVSTSLNAQEINTPNLLDAARKGYELGRAVRDGAPVSPDTSSLLLFGGDGHDVFLGCLNCGSFDRDSICNPYSPYGSQYSAVSIWNTYAKYGSRYNPLSPWNSYGRSPPVIVDYDGAFYGYFTANQYFAKRTSITSLQQVSELGAASDDLTALRDAFCG